MQLLHIDLFILRINRYLFELMRFIEFQSSLKNEPHHTWWGMHAYTTGGYITEQGLCDSLCAGCLYDSCKSGHTFHETVYDEHF